MNRIEKILKERDKVLNIYVTAGCPELDSTIEIVKELDANNVDLIEIGMPYSDPLADGETIQNSSKKALKNGINLNLIFDQVEEIRKTSEIPIILIKFFYDFYCAIQFWITSSYVNIKNIVSFFEYFLYPIHHQFPSYKFPCLYLLFQIS